MQGSAGMISDLVTRSTKSKGVSDHFDTDVSGRLLRLHRFGRTDSDFLVQVHEMSLLLAKL